MTEGSKNLVNFWSPKFSRRQLVEAVVIQSTMLTMKGVFRKEMGRKGVHSTARKTCKSAG